MTARQRWKMDSRARRSLPAFDRHGPLYVFFHSYYEAEYAACVKTYWDGAKRYRWFTSGEFSDDFARRVRDRWRSRMHGPEPEFTEFEKWMHKCEGWVANRPDRAVTFRVAK